MGHCHHHPTFTTGWFFGAAAVINTAFVGVEALYAMHTNSSSLLADAAHNFADVVGLLFAWGAHWMMARRASHPFSYGHKKLSIMAALLNALLLVATCAIIVYEAVPKFFNPVDLNTPVMMIVAGLGIVVNAGTALFFFKDRAHDLNIKGTFLHLAYDALISLGVVVTGGLIYLTQWAWLDPLMGLGIVAIILSGTWGLLQNSFNLLLDAVPEHVDAPTVRAYLAEIPGVKDIHDFHIWGLSSRETALTAHLVMPEAVLSDKDMADIKKTLSETHSIHHVTLQVERGDQAHPCVQQC